MRENNLEKLKNLETEKRDNLIHIVHIDDNTNLIDTYQILLNSQYSEKFIPDKQILYQGFTNYNREAEECIQEMRNAKHQIIIVDLKFEAEEQKGLDIINAIQSKGYTGKIIILTGANLGQEEKYLFSSSLLRINKVLSHPIQLDNLMRVIQSLL